MEKRRVSKKAGGIEGNTRKRWRSTRKKEGENRFMCRIIKKEMKKDFFNVNTLIKAFDILILFVLVISFTVVGQMDFEKMAVGSNPYEIVWVMFTTLGALLCGISIHFILSGIIEIKYMRTQNRLEKQLERLEKNIVNSVSGVRKIVLEHMNDVDEYLANRILEAKKSVYDLNWKDVKWPYKTVHRDEVKMGLLAKKTR